MDAPARSTRSPPASPSSTTCRDWRSRSLSCADSRETQRSHPCGPSSGSCCDSLDQELVELAHRPRPYQCVSAHRLWPACGGTHEAIGCGCPEKQPMGLQLHAVEFTV